MKVNVNPFEPWRPAEAAVPRPLHAARPWRPPPPPPVAAAVEEPPFVEPAEPPPQRNRPQQRREQTSSRRPSLRQWVAFVLMVGWFGFILTADCLNFTYTPHFIVLSCCAVILASLPFDPCRRGWYSRLPGSMVVALALTGIVAWFVPTLHGVNLWSAYRQIEALRALPAGDVAAYQRSAEVRGKLVEEFPSFAADVKAAEQAWLHRTVDEAVEKADRQLEVDPHAALANLHRLNAELTPLEHYASVRKDLDAARRRALQACLKTAAE